MRRKIQVYEGGTAYIGKQAVDEGYKGEIDALFNAVTITLVKPNTDLKSVIRSLEITIQDIKLRMSQEPKEKNNKNKDAE